MATYQDIVYDMIREYRGLGGLHGGREFAVLRMIPEGSNSDITAIPEVQDGEIKHAEIQLLEMLEQKYPDYCNDQDQPEALIIYSWIVPCERCTEAIITKLNSKSSPFAKIKNRIVAYTTDGKNVPGCDVTKSQTMFKDAKIDFIPCKYYPCKFECDHCHMHSQNYCKHQCVHCKAFP